MSFEKQLPAYLALVALLAVAVHGAKIVVTFPAYNVVLKEAFPQADVILLTKGAVDPHEYQLTPQDLEFLKSLGPSDVIVNSMHAPFELKIADMVKSGEIKAKMIDITKFYTYLTFDNREVNVSGAFQGSINPHEHGLYPPNVVKLIRAVSNATGLKPDPQFLQKLEELNKTYAGKFSGRAVAITPPAQYILYWLGYRDIVVLVKEEGVPPTPQDMEKAIQYVKEGAPALAAYVSGERPKIVDQFIQKVKEAGVSNPKIVVASFADNYIDTLAKVAEEIAAQSPASQTATTSGASTPPQTSAAPTATSPPAGGWGDALAWTLVAVVIVVVIGVGAWALRRRK